MTAMTEDDMLLLLKLNLCMTTTAYDDYLLHLLQASRELISREGICLKDSVEDCELTIQYAAYLFRKRADGGAMPRMLRWALNNRLFSQKAGGV